MSDLILLAASGLAREVLSMVHTASRHTVRGVLDDDPALRGRRLGAVEVLGPIDLVSSFPNARLLICAGSGASRSSIRRRLARLGVTDERFATLVDPTVRVPTSCVVGVGSIVMANTVLTADVTVGRHVVTMPHVTLTHDDRLDDFVTVCAGVSLGGSVRVGPGAYLGMNSSVREGTSIGARSVLGMGAVLLTNLPADQIWAGVPARPMRRRLTAVPFPSNFETESRLG